jgi:hypothetical protein
MVVGTNIGSSARNRGAEYGDVPAPGSGGELAIEDVMAVEDVARLTVDAIVAERLYVLPHQASRESIRRRFERIARTFDDQEAAGWTY